MLVSDSRKKLTSLCGPAKEPSNPPPSWPVSVDKPATAQGAVSTCGDHASPGLRLTSTIDSDETEVSHVD